MVVTSTRKYAESRTSQMLNYKYQNLRCQLCFALWSNRNAAHYHRRILWYHCHLIFILYQ